MIESISQNNNFVMILIEIFCGVIFAPIAEELLCRGLVMKNLQKAFSPRTTIVLTGLFFAYLHGNLYQGAYTLPLGIFLAYISMAYDSIFPAILIHSAFNLTNYLFDIPSMFNEPVSDLVTVAMLLFFVFLIPVCIIFIIKYMPKCDMNPISVAPFSYETDSDFNNETTFYTNSEENNMAPDFIIAGLGNPGTKYESTRHNAGFIALDYIAIRENLGTPREKFRSLTWEKAIGGKKVLFMKPQTMMNLSGDAIGEAQRFYKLPPENVLVIFDDINFDPGTIRIKKDGSAGGHNGIKSIIGRLSSEKFPRIKVGVGRLPENYDLADWVLSKPCDADMDKIIQSMESVYGAAKLIIDGDIEKAQAKFNG